MSHPLQSAKKRVGLQGRPRIEDLPQRIEARPAYLRAQQRGGEFGVPAFPD